jgi:hypothetical protein
MTDHNDFPELTDAQKALWRAVTSDVREMPAGLRDDTATQEDMQGALERLRSCDIDREALINAPHFPPDAGPYAQALERILRRIPDGWGRWISHDAGWYPIVATFDERLAAIDPDYVVHQVKEKFGTLRYHCVPSGESSRAPWDRFKDITREAEQASARTCERCGEPGVLHRRNHWLKTLCTSCAETLRYAPIPSPRDHKDCTDEC